MCFKSNFIAYMMLKSVTRKILDQLKGDNATQYEGAQSFFFGEIVSQLDGWTFGEKSSLWQKRSLFDFSVGLKRVLKISIHVLQNLSFNKTFKQPSMRHRRALGGLWWNKYTFLKAHIRCVKNVLVSTFICNQFC